MSYEKEGLEISVSDTWWYTIPAWGKSIHVSAKCGTQTLLKSILQTYGIEDPGMGARRELIHRRLVEKGIIFCNPVPPKELPAVKIMRDPVERFESLVRYVRQQGIDDQNLVRLSYRDSSQEILDVISQNLYANQHWTPQSFATAYATHMASLKNIGEVIPNVEGKENSTKPDVVAGYDEEQLLTMYISDFLLWNELT